MLSDGMHDKIIMANQLLAEVSSIYQDTNVAETWSEAVSLAPYAVATSYASTKGAMFSA